MAERGAQQVAGFLARDVDDHRPRDGVAGHHRQRLGGRGRTPAERRQQFAAVLLARQLRQPPARDAARLEDVAGAIEQSDDAHLPAAVRRANLIRERAADAAEAEEHDVGARRGWRASAADLRQLERGVDASRGFRRLVGRDGERDVALRRSLRDRDDVDAARRERREDARGDARRAGHAVADDGNDRHARARGDVVDEAGSSSSRNAARRLLTARSASPSGSVKPIELSDEA